MSQISFVMALCLAQSALAAPQNVPGAAPGPDAQKCAALVELNLEAVPGGPAVVTSAYVVEVPATGLTGNPSIIRYGKGCRQSTQKPVFHFTRPFPYLSLAVA
ncbi:MAG TPA: hypothetical protein VIX91_14215 [Candidatus Acidoferrum sp.]